MFSIKEESKDLLPLPASGPSSSTRLDSTTCGSPTTNCSEDSAASALLGATVTVRVESVPAAHATRASASSSLTGTLLEVRRLWIPPEARSAPSSPSPPTKRWRLSATTTAAAESSLSEARVVEAGGDGPLLAYVQLKDGDHRLSGWVPLPAVEVKELPSGHNHASALPSAVSLSPPSSQGHIPFRDLVLPTPLARLVNRPVLSRIYWQVTPGMARTVRAQKQLDYLEERLLRDCHTPTTVRYMVYLQEYLFAPWYYAPYGLLHASFDPLGPEAVSARCRSDKTPPSPPPSHAGESEQHRTSVKVRRLEETERSESVHEEAEEEMVVLPVPASLPAVPQEAVTHATQTRESDTQIRLPNPPAVALRVNPYIRDAYLCPFSLRVFPSASQLRHEIGQYRADRLHPPGVEIYRDTERGFSLFEVNGSRYVTYCRHLFLLGKSFLENKLAGHDVHNYYFYVVCLHHRHAPSFIADTSAMYFASYFTWEKQVSECNLACIVTLPCFATQSGSGTESRGAATLKGLGQFMITVSYELAYRRRQVGSPEKPLSDLGAAAYQRYWQRVLVRWMYEHVVQHQRSLAIHIAPSSASTSQTESQDAGAEAAESDPQSITLRLKDIAEQVRLEEADVHATLLVMGVLHRCADDRSTQLLIPESFVRWAVAREEASQQRLDVAVFCPEKLLTKKQTSSAAATTAPVSASAPTKTGRKGAPSPASKRR